MSRPIVRTIAVHASTGEFAEDKDGAASLREREIRPAIKAGQRIVIDFKGVGLTTQSFVHALISDVLRTEGESILDRMTFKGCNRSVKGIIETVVQYTLESTEPQSPTPEIKSRALTPSPRSRNAKKK